MLSDRLKSENDFEAQYQTPRRTGVMDSARLSVVWVLYSQLFTFDETETDMAKLYEKIDNFVEKSQDTLMTDYKVIIPNSILQLAIKDENEGTRKEKKAKRGKVSKFILGAKVSTMIVHGANTEDKQDIARWVRVKSENKVSVALGDSMADVPMMQEASVGICVLGDKVNYTLPYADMVILKIGDLQRLMLWHGRGIAQRLVELAVMVILKGMVHTTCILSV